MVYDNFVLVDQTVIDNILHKNIDESLFFNRIKYSQRIKLIFEEDKDDNDIDFDKVVIDKLGLNRDFRRAYKKMKNHN